MPYFNSNTGRRLDKGKGEYGDKEEEEKKRTGPFPTHRSRTDLYKVNSAWLRSTKNWFLLKKIIFDTVFTLLLFGKEYDEVVIQEIGK